MKEKKPQTLIKILLADDDEDDRFFFAEALKELPMAFQLQTVVDGTKLMEYLSKNEASLPDVLFLDINMPRKNGEECLEEIKQNAKLKQLPVVIYSTSISPKEADLFYQSGAHYYLHKCDFGKLKHRLTTTITQLMANPAQPTRDKFILS